MKKTVDAFDYAGTVCKELSKGILITTKLDGKVNTMTIGWGHIGIEWGRPIFVAYVRETRYTKQMLEENGEFTVNVSLGDPDKEIISVCGTKSGRDMDKIAHLGLTLEDSDTISVPGIKEMPLTLECKVIYKQDQDLSFRDEDKRLRYYKPGTHDDGDFHTAYYGEVVAAYIIED